MIDLQLWQIICSKEKQITCQHLIDIVGVISPSQPSTDIPSLSLNQARARPSVYCQSNIDTPAEHVSITDFQSKEGKLFKWPFDIISLDNRHTPTHTHKAHDTANIFKSRLLTHFLMRANKCFKLSH